MSVVLFDTHAFIKRLTAAGMPEGQAEVLAYEHARPVDERLATQRDLANLATKDELKAAIAEAKNDIIKWMFGTIGFQTVVILGAVIALARAFH